MAVEAESRLLGTGAFVEPHVAPLLVRPIRFQFLQLCCLGARMVDRPLLPTASNRDASNVLDYLEIPVARQTPGPLSAATETLLPAASLLVKGEGGEATKNGATRYTVRHLKCVDQVSRHLIIIFQVPRGT